MTWIVNQQSGQAELAARFRKFMEAPGILQIPGTHDAMAGLIAKKIGFTALYLSGAAYTASRGLPDLGIVTSSEVAERARDIIRATDLPVLVDIDTGFGGVLNVARTAREMQEAGIAAVQLEDQDLPKKCGHLNGKKLIAINEMTQKIKMIKQTAPSLVIVARTDARAVEGVEAAMERAAAKMKEQYEQDKAAAEELGRKLSENPIVIKTKVVKNVFHNNLSFIPLLFCTDIFFSVIRIPL